MKHIVLLGDSIFDNSSYVNPGELDVPNQLRSLVNNDCKVTNLAVDGNVTKHINNQLKNLPADATHLSVSVGGNDGLGHLSIFNQWGEIIFESYDHENGWNGNYGRAFVKMGVYIWKIDYKNTLDDENYTQIGHVTVIK